MCNTCYLQAQRDHSLNEYPTNAFLKNPDDYIRWAFEQFPTSVQDIAVEYGYRVTKRNNTP